MTSFAHAHVVVEAEKLADTLASELDRILNRVLRTDPVLVLERESAKHWILVDQANGDVVMMRASEQTCRRFAETFVVRTPGATFKDLGEDPKEGAPGRPATSDPAFSLADPPSVKGDEPASSPKHVSREEAFAIQSVRLLELLAEGHSVKAPEPGLATVHQIRKEEIA